jgi:hypothetical protein
VLGSIDIKAIYQACAAAPQLGGRQPSYQRNQAE